MRKILKIKPEDAEGKILIATKDIINCYKKGVLVATTSLFEELSFIDGWVSVFAEYVDDNMEIQYWLDDEILPEIPEDCTKALNVAELKNLIIIEDEGMRKSIVGVTE